MYNIYMWVTVPQFKSKLMCLMIWHTDANIQKLWIENYDVYRVALINVTPVIVTDNRVIW